VVIADFATLVSRRDALDIDCRSLSQDPYWSTVSQSSSPHSCYGDRKERRLLLGGGKVRRVRWEDMSNRRQRDATFPPRLHRHLHLRDLHYWRLPAQPHGAHCMSRLQVIRRARMLTKLQAFTAIHIAAITATSWILMLNGAVGYQLLDDGTAVSIGLLFISSLLIFIGTGYIALDTGFDWTGYWSDTRTLMAPNQHYALYTLYQLVPLVFLVIFFLLEAFLVLRVLGERKPMREYRPLAPMNATNVLLSLPPRRSLTLRHWTNLPVCNQRAYLPRDRWQN
jgi:hypothetical protein